MSDRIPCCVPHCRRTLARKVHPNATEVICQRCWARIPRRLRLLYRKVQRRAEMFYLNRSNEHRARDARAVYRLWDKCKQKAMPV